MAAATYTSRGRSGGVGAKRRSRLTVRRAARPATWAHAAAPEKRCGQPDRWLFLAMTVNMRRNRPTLVMAVTAGTRDTIQEPR